MEEIQDTAAFMQKYRQLLEQGETLMLPVLGHSMSPFLVHNRDVVWLSATSGPYKTGDIVLYRRSSGSYILHRICKVNRNGYAMVGDAHSVIEKNVQEQQIIAVVVRVMRKNQIEEPGTFLWELFARAWIRMVPLRPLITRIYTKLKKCRRAL